MGVWLLPKDKMARVCIDWFPETNGFYLDDRLVMEIEIFLKNIKQDWDFTILISGQGEVRVGKSMLAMQIACYWAYEIQKRYKIKIPFSVEENFVFDGKKLIQIGNALGQSHPYSPLVFDEAGADLEGRKAIQTQTQDVLDFFRECGQYNLLNILVIPEFYDLPKGIAMTRSALLLDVFYQVSEDGIFERGYYYVYGKRSKKRMYLIGKRDLDYSVVRSDWGKLGGRFYKYYTISEKGYKEAKMEALRKRENKKRNRFQLLRDAAWFLLCKEFGLSQSKLGQRMENLTGIYCPQETISDAIVHLSAEVGDFTTESQ